MKYRRHRRHSLHCRRSNPLSPVQEGCDYLIARTSEGKLDLRDIFVQDKELGISSRPQVVGDIPEQPLYFQEWPWVVEFTGDRVNGKMPWKRVSASPASCHHDFPDIL